MNKTPNEQIKLNNRNDDEIEWKIDGENVVPKSINLLKLTKSEFKKKTIKFKNIMKKENEKLFEKSLNLYVNDKYRTQTADRRLMSSTEHSELSFCQNTKNENYIMMN